MFSGWNRNLVAVSILLSIGVLCSHAQSVYFQLYTPLNREVPAILMPSDPTSIASSAFNPRWPTVIFVHGYQSDQTVYQMYRDTYLAKQAYNFIAVDWLYAAGTFNYITAKGYVPLVGGKLANLLDALETDHKLIIQNVTIVGHSLGK